MLRVWVKISQSVQNPYPPKWVGTHSSGPFEARPSDDSFQILSNSINTVLLHLRYRFIIFAVLKPGAQVGKYFEQHDHIIGTSEVFDTVKYRESILAMMIVRQRSTSIKRSLLSSTTYLDIQAV